jgi:dienelactone hydrolase
MRGRPGALALLILVMLSCAPIASAEELVRITGGPSLLDLIRQRQARERGETPAAAAETVDAYMSRPDGSRPDRDGRFPAIVYLHGCGGLSEKTRHRVADLMTGWGYVTLAVDSFASRGITEACTRDLASRKGDALEALRYLSGLGFVDPDRIALVGASQGGGIGLQIASARAVAAPEQPKFRAVVAYYPPCRLAAEQLTIPVLVLIGEVDDWTPAGDCESWMQRRAGKGAPVRLVVYPGAYHSFDNPGAMIGGRYFGHWLKYDADAARRAIGDMHEFLQAQFTK